MFRRVTKTVQDYGTLVPYDSYISAVDDNSSDWYFSPFIYGEDAKEYFEEHKSIKGYNGEVFTNMLYWDLDYKEDFSKVQEHTRNLLDKLQELDLIDSTEVFFSGNKGVHVIVHVMNKLTPQQVSKICFNLAKEVGIPCKAPEKIFDTTVYNTNRIFRIQNTKHPESKLYKIELTDDDLALKEEEIRKLAEKPGPDPLALESVDVADIIDQYGRIQEPVLVNMEDFRTKDGFNPMDCPPDKRRCIYMLEHGQFGPGERENATLRLAAYHKGQNMSKEAIYDITCEALKEREKVHGKGNPYTDSDIWRNIDQVFSDGWQGGTFTCKTDDYLAGKCNLGNGPCWQEHVNGSKLNALSVNGLIDAYKKYGMEALSEYPRTGLDWLDDNIRLRPRNYSIINGANGSGKTSLALQIMDNLNQQEMQHVIFSLDMADTSLFEKIGSRYTDYSQEQIERAFNIHFRDTKGNDRVREEVAAVLRERLPYTYFDFTSSVDPKYMESTVRKMKEQGINIQLCIVDYAGRLTGDGDNGFSLATNNAKAANDIAKRGNVHYIYLSQIPRGEGDHTKPLHSSRVSKNSGDWEENATIVMNCWRPFGDGIDDLDNYMHIYIAKNRSGPLLERAFHWDGKKGILRELNNSEFLSYEHLRREHNMSELPGRASNQEMEGEVSENVKVNSNGGNTYSSNRSRLKNSTRSSS